MAKKRELAYVNGAIIVLNVLYFLYLEIVDSSLNSRYMIHMGAMYAPLVLEEGQYYRLLTSVFMHFGIRHLLNNMLVLFILGDNLERALGKVKYIMFYLLCGIGANVFSLVIDIGTDGYYTVSAGASGAIFGVVGGLIYAVAVNRGRLEDLSSNRLIAMAVLSLYFGFASTGVDNAAHVGGLVLGLILGVIFYRKPKGKGKKGGYRYKDWSD